MRLLSRFIVPAVTVSVISMQQAMAALPTDATDSLADAKTDGLIVAGTVLGIIIAIAAFKFIRRAL